MHYTAFISVFNNWWIEDNRKFIPNIKEIKIIYFDPQFLMGSENKISHRTKITFYYVIKKELNVKFVTQKEAYQSKVHGD